MALILALLPSPVARARLKEAVRMESAARVQHEVRWAEMHALAAASAAQRAIFIPSRLDERQRDYSTREKYRFRHLLPCGGHDRPTESVLEVAACYEKQVEKHRATWVSGCIVLWL